MAKLLKTVETFELRSREDAGKLVSKFKTESFPRLVEHRIFEEDDKVLLEAVKEFGADVNEMKFEQ